ncbi:MAG TPA: SDR family oxidoreductase [Gemmataceae bacterium]|jgi:NAD(P)-dependent dehydrogenase (short-subunit alcohol dehydrogenase family)|nr:SDR family oxidoreductase [Gemmataceae bacterium]
MSRNNKKLVLITGVTRGLGLAMAEKFIALGHTIAGCGRSKSAIEKLHSTYAEPHDFTSVDVTDDDQVRVWAERLLKSHGPPDLLLNNAAIINKNAVLWKVPRAEFDQVIDVNVKGVVNVIRHFLPAMIEKGSGVIVNFSSGWGRSVDAEVAPYCATKWAIEGLTRALALELPKGMAAVPLNPGIIDTDMLHSTFGGSSRSYPSPEQWSEKAVPFLLGLGPKDNGKALTAP